MKSLASKIAAVTLSLAFVFIATRAWSSSSMGGGAELSYTKYDASVNGSEVFSGSTLAQKYSLIYTATNLSYRSQPTYYNLMAGYDFVDFNTKVTDLTQEYSIKQNYGKFKYSGVIAYNEQRVPFKFKAFINDTQPINLNTSLTSGALIDDGLLYAITGRGTSVASGVSMAFEPENSRNISIRSLPRVLFDYRDTASKSSESFYRMDNRLREVAVAGINKENNWVHYRLMNFEDYLQPLSNYTRQQLQVGLVDHVGRRKWSALTNWIEISADAQLTELRSPSRELNRNLEEYDVNFMAVASRQKWSARTFLNYNRLLNDEKLTENTNVPIYLTGIYGSETTWRVNLTAARGREHNLSSLANDTSYVNNISLGATTFTRSKFTLTPSLELQTSKMSGGNDAYSVSSNLEAVSTRRFSDKMGLGSRLYWRAMDDGSGTFASKSWSAGLGMDTSYRPSGTFAYKFQDTVEFGSGHGYLDPTRFSSVPVTSLGYYLRNYALASAGWTPNARFATSLLGTYDYVAETGSPESIAASAHYRATYEVKSVSYKVNSKYDKLVGGFNQDRSSWVNSAETQYRPDRYVDSVFRLTHEQHKDYSMDYTKLELVQRYSYNFFTKKGVSRSIATLTEEYSYSRTISSPSLISDVQYLMISGRCSPTDRYTLYGSAKYIKESPLDSVTMYYNAGISADFRLLAGSIDYTVAKRDIDNRIEKKLAASVRRTF